MFLAHGAEDEVGVLFGHILQLGLCAVEKSLAHEATRAYGYLALVHVVARSVEVLLKSEQHFDTLLLVGLQHIVEHITGGVEHGKRTYGKESYKHYLVAVGSQTAYDEVYGGVDTQGQQEPAYLYVLEDYLKRVAHNDGECAIET